MTLEQFIDVIALPYNPGDRDLIPRGDMTVIGADGEPVISEVFVDHDHKPAKDNRWWSQYRKAKISEVFVDGDADGCHLDVWLKAGDDHA